MDNPIVRAAPNSGVPRDGDHNDLTRTGGTWATLPREHRAPAPGDDTTARRSAGERMGSG